MKKLHHKIKIFYDNTSILHIQKTNLLNTAEQSKRIGKRMSYHEKKLVIIFFLCNASLKNELKRQSVVQSTSLKQFGKKKLKATFINEI